MDSIINSNISDHDLLLISVTMLETMQKSMVSIERSLETKAELKEVEDIKKAQVAQAEKIDKLTIKVYTLSGILAGAQAVLHFINKQHGG